MSKTIIAVKAVGNSDNFSKELRDLEVGKTEAFDNYCEDKRTLNVRTFKLNRTYGIPSIVILSKD